MRAHRRARGRIAVVLLAVVLLAPRGIASTPAAAADGGTDPVVRWNRTFLEGVRQSTLAPPAVARGLAILNTCIYDAWAAYDPIASGTRLGTSLRRPPQEWTDTNRISAISVAAHAAAVDLLPSQRSRFEQLLHTMASDRSRSAGPDSPSGIGARACRAVLDFRHQDGSNQLGDAWIVRRAILGLHELSAGQLAGRSPGSEPLAAAAGQGRGWSPGRAAVRSPAVAARRSLRDRTAVIVAVAGWPGPLRDQPVR